MAKRITSRSAGLLGVAVILLAGLVCIEMSARAAPATQPSARGAAATVSPSLPISDDQVGTAISGSVDFLLAHFDGDSLRHLDGQSSEMDRLMLNNLCVLALLEASRATGDPRVDVKSEFMRSVLDAMKKQRLESVDSIYAPVTSARAFRASALAVYSRADDRSALRADVDWLMRAHRGGAYSSDDRFGGPVEETAPPPWDSDRPTIAAGRGLSLPRGVIAGPGTSGGGGTVKPGLGTSGRPDLGPSRAPDLGASRARNLGPSQPPIALGPSRPPNLNPSTPPYLGPSARPYLGPSARPYLGPSTPPNLDPSQPPNLGPSRPPNLDPSSPPNLDPSNPPNLDPSHPPDLDPSTPPILIASPTPDLRPSRPPNLNPSHPPDLTPSPPPVLAPSPLPDLNPSPLPDLNPSPLPNLNPSTLPTTRTPDPRPTTAPIRTPATPSSYQPITMAGGGAVIVGGTNNPTYPTYPIFPPPPGTVIPTTPLVPDTTRVPEIPQTPHNLNPLPFPWDNYNSILALLGVWAGAEAGIEVPDGYWAAVEGHWLRHELATGQWYYNDYNTIPSIGMSFAGNCALMVTHDWQAISKNTPGRNPWSAGLIQSMKWMESTDNSVTIKDDQTLYVGFNLFILERCGMASGFKYFGSHDWYRELAARVVPTQWPNGAFGKATDGYEAIAQTAFTTLFLSRGRHPVTIEKLRFGDSWANRPRDVVSVARFASRELERQLNWQAASLDHDFNDWLDAPLLFIASHLAPDFTDADVTKLRSYAQSGGLLFTHSDSPAFNQYVENTLAKQLFPQYAMQDVSPRDPIWSVQYRLKPPLPKLRGIHNGSRWLLIHSPADLASTWQGRGGTTPRCDLPVNLLLYAGEKAEMRNRIAPPLIPPATTSTKPASRTTKIARLSYNGNWDPEPLAWSRASRWMQVHADRNLKIATIAIADLKPSDGGSGGASNAPSIAILTGTAEYQPTEVELAAIKSYVESGGWLLIDNCGGGGAFAHSVESWLVKLTPEKPSPIIPTDPLLKGGNELDDLTKPHYREGTQARAGASTQLMSVKLGKGQIIYSPIDLTTGILGANPVGVIGYQPASALSLAKNVILRSGG